MVCGSDTEEDGGSEETQVPSDNLKQRMHGRYCRM